MSENEIQRKILSICSFLPNGGTYLQLKPKDPSPTNDLYDCHLQQLVKNGLLLKTDQTYFLTEQGKSLVTNIDHDTKVISQNYKVSVYMMPVINGKILLYTRLKHPQYEYTGLISGKIKYGESILDTAKREFTEETGLSAEFKIIGNLRQIRKNKKNEVIEDGVFYICFADEVSGSLTETNIEGRYFWIELEKVSALEKIFKPSLEICVNEAGKRINDENSWNNQFIYELHPEPEDY